MEKTVRKGGKEFSAALAGARNVREFSLDNGFSGNLVPAIPAWLGSDFRLSRRDGKYVARAHSNLWFEFEAA